MTTKPSIETTAGQEDLKRRGIRPWPEPDDATRPYWDAAAHGRLLIPKCAECGQWQWPPAEHCTACDSGQITWTELGGLGTVYSYIVDHRNMVPGFEGAYIVAQVVPVEVEDESVRLTTNLPGCAPEDVRIGMEVAVTYEELRPGVSLPQFTSTAGSD
jgi:uncharacterized OB-fold protein